MDTELRMPAVDFSTAAKVTLSFKAYYLTYEGSKADADIWTGENWINVWRKTDEDYFGLVSLDVTPYAAGKSSVIVSFRYYDANYCYYWQIDDVKLEGISKPSAPGGLGAAANGGKINLSWTDNSSDETMFIVERSTTADSGFEQIGSAAANSTSYADGNGLACDTTYYYRIYAKNSVGVSGYSNTSSAGISECSGLSSLDEGFDDLTMPDGWSVVNNLGDEGWRFDNPYNEDAYTTGNFAIADSGNAGDEGIDSELRTPVLDLSGRPAVKLSFGIMYFDEKGSVDVDVSLDGGDTWTNAERFSTTIFYDPIKQKTIDLSEIAGGQSHVMVRFRANIANGTYNALCAIDDVKLESLALPGAPSNVSAALNEDGAVILSWTNDDMATITIERSADCDEWTTIAEITNGATTYVDNNVGSETAYCYRLKATNAAGSSNYSVSLNITSGDRSVMKYDITVSYYDTAENTESKKEAIENIIRYFADAVYEMSNGVQKLRQVSIYTNAAMADKANVVWIEECHPCANISGYGTEGMMIEMCDVFSSQDYLVSDYWQKVAGYGSLGHEWGHYFHSLYDEYQGGTEESDDPGTPLSTDDATSNSIMSNGDYAADGDLSWINFSTPLNINEDTAQYRVYGASAWETLIRPLSEDPRDGNLSILDVRLYHQELVDAAPVDENGDWHLNTIELTEEGALAAARSELDIVWLGETAKSSDRSGETVANQVARQVVVDCSDNMSQKQLDEIKSSLDTILGKAETGDIWGIICFDDEPSVLYPLTAISGDSDRQAAQAAIEKIALSKNDADMGKAIRKALDDLNDSVSENIDRVVYLITAGPHGSGEHPLSVIPSYQDNNVKLFTFGYAVEQGVAADLQLMAEQTGGKYRFAGTGSDLEKALENAKAATATLPLANIASKWYFPDSFDDYDITIPVDSSLADLGLFITYYSDSHSVSMTLTDPEGNAHSIAPDSCENFDDEWGSGSYCTYILEEPSAGDWTLNVTTGEDLVDLYLFADGLMKEGTLPFNPVIQSSFGTTISYPDPILISASISRKLPITGGVVQGTVQDPDGYITEFELYDDGIAPDDVAEDGNYAALLPYEMNGEHYITVFFDNSNGKARYTRSGVVFLSPGSGDLPEESLVGENYQRIAELQVNITDWKADDHPDWYTEEPTVLTTANESVRGKIDFADDMDVFKITVPDDFEGEMVVRIDQLALEMDPYLYIFAEDFSWERTEFLEYAPTSDDYLIVRIAVMPGEVFYVGVLHYDIYASEGLYSISAGPALASEQAEDAASVPGKDTAAIPTLDTWGLLLFGMILTLVAIRRLRSQA